MTQLKATLFFGEYKTAQTILKALGEEYDYFPKYAEQILFELYDWDTQPYIYAAHNGQPLKLGGKAENGHIMFNVFMDFICDKIYFGNIDDVKTGDEKYRNQEYQKQNNPVCVEILYNLPFKNNEYLFEDIYGIKVSEV